MPRGLRIEMLQDAMKMAGAVLGGGGAEALAEIFGALRQVGETFEKSAEIETGADSEDGETIAGAKIGEHCEGAFAVITSSGGFAGFDDVEEVMGDGGAFACRGLGGADVETAIELGGIASQNFTAEFFGEVESESGLAGSGGADDGEESWIGHERMGLRVTSMTWVNGRRKFSGWRRERI